jgi:hypothetical protein
MALASASTKWGELFSLTLVGFSMLEMTHGLSSRYPYDLRGALENGVTLALHKNNF